MAARLLTGDYGDVILSSYGIYTRDVLATDTFEDLTDWIKSQDNYKDLNENAIKAAEVDGVLRGVPAALASSYYIGNEELVKEADTDQNGALTWSEILNQGLKWKEGGNTEHYLFDSLESFTLSNIVYSNIYDLVDLKNKKVDIRQEWFLDLIDQWKKMQSTEICGVPGEDFDPTMQTWTGYAFQHGAMLGAGRFDLTDSDTPSLQDMQDFYLDEERAGVSFCMLNGISGEKNTNYMAFPRYFFSVNNTSEKKTEAEDFLAILLSEEIQKKVPRNLMPLNKKALDYLVEVDQEYGSNLSYEQIKEYYEMKEALLDQADWMYSYLCGQDLCDALEKYATGKVSLDSALDEAEEKMWMRINE